MLAAIQCYRLVKVCLGTAPGIRIRLIETLEVVTPLSVVTVRASIDHVERTVAIGECHAVARLRGSALHGNVR